MSVEISDADWKVLDWATPGGVKEDDVAYSINAYREEGKSDEEIQDIFNQHIGNLRPKYDDVMRQVRAPNPELDRMKAKQAWMEKYVDPVMDAVGAAGHTMGRAGNTMTFGGFDAAAATVDNLAGYAGIQTNLVKYIDDANKRWPIPTMVGDVGGLFSGLPKALVEGTMKVGSKVLGPASTKLGKMAKGAVIGAGSNLAVQGGMEIQKTAEKIAGTREAEVEKEFYDRVTNETAWSLGLGAATGAIMGPFGMVGTKVEEGTRAAQKAKNVSEGAQKAGNMITRTIDAQTKAIDLCGGPAVVKNAQAAFQDVVAGGGSVEQGENAFWRVVMEQADPRKQESIKRLIKTDPGFSRYMRTQMASAGAVVQDTMVNLTKPQLGEYAHQVRKSLYGENYINKAGSTDFDNTKEGLAQILGTDDGGAMYKAREEALGRAKDVVAASPEVQGQVLGEFNELTNNLRNKGEGIYRAMVNKVEAGTIRSYAGSKEAEEANSAFQQWILKRQANGIKTSPERAEQARREFERAGAQKYFDRKMTVGTENIDDINDIKTFFKEQAPSDVTKGQSTALGAFDEGINSNIYDKLDQGLYETNQAYRYTNKMQDMHGFGYKFDPDSQIVALDRELSNTTDAEFAAAKLAAFKMGWTAKLQDAAVSGNTIKYEELAAKMRNGPFAKYFSQQEVAEIIDQVKPHVEAKFLIEQNLKAAQGVVELSREDIQVLRTLTSAGVGARGAFIGNLTTYLSNYRYGPKTAKAIMDLAKNPSIENMNNILKNVKDPVEKRTIINGVGWAFNQMVKDVASAPIRKSGVFAIEEAAITKGDTNAND